MYSESERSLIESGFATYAEIRESRRLLAEAIAAEAEAQLELRRYDETHCPVCGAEISDTAHCR